jgi:hypothetical protein
VAVAGGFRLDAGASVSAVAPFSTAAHRTGLADFPHPALGQASRESMRGPSAQAHLLEIDHSRLPVDLGVAETLGSSDAQFVPSTQKPPDTVEHVPERGARTAARRPGWPGRIGWHVLPGTYSPYSHGLGLLGPG